jgi:hypothetical protein
MDKRFRLPDDYERCTECGGTGRVPAREYPAEFAGPPLVRCSACAGTGEVRKRRHYKATPDNEVDTGNDVMSRDDEPETEYEAISAYEKALADAQKAWEELKSSPSLSNLVAPIRQKAQEAIYSDFLDPKTPQIASAAAEEGARFLEAEQPTILDESQRQWFSLLVAELHLFALACATATMAQAVLKSFEKPK